MATKNTTPAPTPKREINPAIAAMLDGLDKAKPTRPRGLFMDDGEYIITVENYGHQAPALKGGKAAMVFDGKIEATNSKKRRRGEPVHWRYADNESFLGNMRQLAQAFGASSIEEELEMSAKLMEGDADLEGRKLLVRATTIKKKDGEDFTQIYVVGFAPPEYVIVDAAPDAREVREAAQPKVREQVQFDDADIPF